MRRGNWTYPRLVVPPRNPGALADALVELITDPTLAARLGHAARRDVENRFDIDRNIGDYRRLFA